VTALSAETLEQEHVTNITDLASLAPNLHISQTVTQGDAATFYLRGFGAQTNDPAVDPHVAVFIDGIYQPATLGTMIDMFDVDQVEVMAGPQGTLLGKNAPVGAISITTARPTGRFGGEAEADYGRFDHVGARFKLNVPLIQDVLAAKVSFVDKNGGNWVYNTYTNERNMGGEDARVGRLALAFTPTDQFTWNLTTSYLDSKTPQPGNRSIAYMPPVPGNSSTVNQPGNPLAPGLLPTNTYTICFYYPNLVCPPTRYGTTSQSLTAPNRENLFETASNMSYHLAPVTLTSITGYYHNWQVDNAGVSGTQFDNLNSYDSKLNAEQFSEEFRVSSNKGQGWDLGGFLDWVAGAYYQHYQYANTNNLGIGVGLFGMGDPTGSVINDQQQQHALARSWAGFTHLIFNLTDKWTGTFGVRYSADHKEHDYLVAGSTIRYYDTPADFNNTSIEIGTAYQFDAEHMAYLRFAQGYQAGGFTGFPSVPNGGSSFKPELNNSYEVGFKSDWLDKRLRANLAFFINQISQLQVESVEPNAEVGFIQVTNNAGSATIQGAEAQFIAVPMRALTLRLNVGYLDPTYNQYHGTSCSPIGVVTDCSGIPFEYAPKWTIDLGGRYVMNLPHDLGTATFSTDWNFRSSLYPASPPIPAAFQTGYGLLNAGLMFSDPSDRYSVEFYGTNILNRQYKASVTDPGGLALVQDDGRPAEWGIRVRAKFGQ
jgi:iron complex outermembrane receptor protein